MGHSLYANILATLIELFEDKGCVLFISKYYEQKVWTNHERRSAQARAVTENREYILPVRLDETEIPGLTQTIRYFEFNKVSLEGLVEATLKNLS